MDNERWNRVDKLLQSALDRPAADRERFLRSASGGDEQLEQDVRSLLIAHDRAGSFLAGPAIGVACPRKMVRTIDSRSIASDTA